MKARLGFLTFLGVAIILLAGCTEASEYKEQIEGLQAQIESLRNQNSLLEQDIQNMTVSEVELDTSLQVVEGTNVKEFVKIEDKIVFPNKLVLPDSKDDVNNSYFMVGSRYKFYPSSNWEVKMDGATMRLAHPANIWGSIKAVTVRESMVNEEDMKALLQGFYKDFPATTITYRKAFIDDRVAGMFSKANIEVDKEPHVVNVGFVSRGEYGVLFLFDYKDDGNGVQQELVDLLISSGEFGDNRIKLE